MPGTAAVALPRFPVSIAVPAALPGLASLLAAALSGDGRVDAFRADAAGLFVAVAVAAFGSGSVPARIVRIVLAALWLLLVHAGRGLPPGAPDGGTTRFALLALGVMGGAAGFRALGEATGCPPAAAGGLALGALLAAFSAVWWADGLAAAVPLERRAAVREAALSIDPLSAAAYDVDGYDRLKTPEIYEETTIATVGVPPPSATKTAAIWGATGVAAALAALALAFAKRRLLARRAEAVAVAAAGAP